jgi:hypothetical protein
MIKLKGNFSYWDPETRLCVCPVPYRQSPEKWNKLISNLEKMDFSINGEIDMPIDTGYRYLVAMPPDWLTLDDNEDNEESLIFRDKEDRIRMHISTQIYLPNTWVMTRYYTYDKLIGDKFVTCVYDTEAVREDDDLEYAKPLWKAPEAIVREERTQIAEKWLDKNFPFWQDPMAYWS